MRQLSISEATRLISARLQVPRLIPEVPESPWQDRFTAQLGMKLADFLEERAVGGTISESKIDKYVKEVQEMFDQERDKAVYESGFKE